MKNIIVFTDGSSRGNPGPGGWASICAYEVGNESKVFEIGGAEKKTTNNRMEIKASLEALKKISQISSTANLEGQIQIYTDSAYLINGITKWIFGWQKNDWQTSAKEPVLNKDLWEELAHIVKNLKIEWKHIEGHSGIPGNERCDEIATRCADGENVSLYEGSYLRYGIDITTFAWREPAKKIAGSSNSLAKSGAKAHSYISEIDGIIKIHKTWKECEERVRGKSKARFRKSLSKEDEEKIIKSFK